jgi:peptidoglycan/xylan/chitin deacetylase (PgdA/CDA1 family)
LFEALQPLPDSGPQAITTDLLSWAGIETFNRPTHRTLSPDEVVELAEGGLVEVASHTVNHPVLSCLPAPAQKNEIVSSKRRLEEILGQPIGSFAYPYGRRLDYTNDTIAAVREAGFHCACSNFAGSARAHTDVWQLPRFLVRDWNGEEFNHRLSQWLNDY